MQCKFQNLHCIFDNRTCRTNGGILQKTEKLQNYAADLRKNLQSKVIMQAKMQEYIRMVLQFLQKNVQFCGKRRAPPEEKAAAGEIGSQKDGKKFVGNDRKPRLKWGNFAGNDFFDARDSKKIPSSGDDGIRCVI